MTGGRGLYLGAWLGVLEKIRGRDQIRAGVIERSTLSNVYVMLIGSSYA